jgi:hypothetical protein
VWAALSHRLGSGGIKEEKGETLQVQSFSLLYEMSNSTVYHDSKLLHSTMLSLPQWTETSEIVNKN